MSDTAAPTLSDRYELQDELGRGGFGVVIRAMQKATGQLVAIKKLELSGPTPSDENWERHKERFLREMRLIGKLHSAHAVRLIDAGFDNEAPFMVLELVEGQTLHDVLRRGPLKPELAKRVVSQVLEAVASAHDLGIVHRDLKPDNIMLTGSGIRMSAKVLDFGIAGIQESFKDTEHVTITQFGQVYGTPPYMAPEQLQAFSEPRTQSDVYAMGLILLECLTGVPAVTGESIMEIVRKQVSEPVNIPPVIRQSGFGSIIARACSKSIDERYPTAEAMLQAVHRISDDELAHITTGSLLSNDVAAVASPTAPVPMQAERRQLANAPTAANLSIEQPQPPSNANHRLLKVAVALVVALVSIAVWFALTSAPNASSDAKPPNPPKGATGEPQPRDAEPPTVTPQATDALARRANLDTAQAAARLALLGAVAWTQTQVAAEVEGEPAKVLEAVKEPKPEELPLSRFGGGGRGVGAEPEVAKTPQETDKKNDRTHTKTAKTPPIEEPAVEGASEFKGAKPID